MKKAVGYLRRSTDKQEQSLEDQKREIISFAQREGFELTEWYADDAISGAFSENRSQFQELIRVAQAKNREFDFIIVYDVARFSRGDNTEVGHYLYLLRKAGVDVLYVKENLKGDDADEILRPIFQFNANLYLKSLSRDTIRGQVTSAREGRFLGGPISYGYKRVINETGKSSLAFDNEDKQKIVHWIFDRYVQKDMGYRHIADKLNKEGIPAPRGGTWTSSCIRAILLNPIYYGAFVWNRRTLSKFHSVRNGQAEKRPRTEQNKVGKNPESEWFVKEGAYPAIITKELWQVAQSKRAGKENSRNQYRGRISKSTYLLTGLIRCQKCGYPYYGTKKTSGKGIKTLSYTCGGYWTRGNTVCSSFSFASHKLEEHIAKGIQQRLSQGNLYADVLAEIKSELNARFKDPTEEIMALEFKIKSINKKIDALLDAIDPVHKELLNRKLGELSGEKKRLEAEIVRLKAGSQTGIDLEKASKEILAGLGEFDQIFTEEAPVNEKKTFIRRYVGAVKIVPQEKKALVGWYRLPRPSLPMKLVAGVEVRPLEVTTLITGGVVSVTVVAARF